MNPNRRLIDRCKWLPWAYINDSGCPIQAVPPALFIAVVIPCRAIIERMMQRDPPHPSSNRPR